MSTTRSLSHTYSPDASVAVGAKLLQVLQQQGRHPSLRCPWIRPPLGCSCSCSCRWRHHCHATPSRHPAHTAAACTDLRVLAKLLLEDAKGARAAHIVRHELVHLPHIWGAAPTISTGAPTKLHVLCEPGDWT
jgi:hypothetical protein